MSMDKLRTRHARFLRELAKKLAADGSDLHHLFFIGVSYDEATGEFTSVDLLMGGYTPCQFAAHALLLRALDGIVEKGCKCPSCAEALQRVERAIDVLGFAELPADGIGEPAGSA